MNKKLDKIRIPRKERSVNKHLFTLLSDYNKLVNRKERKFDVLLAIGVSFVVLLITVIFIHSNRDVLALFKVLNDSTIGVMAILAGFNISSLALIGAANLTFLKKINKTDLLKQILIIFAFSVILNLFLIMLGIVVSIVSSQFLQIQISLIVLWHWCVYVLLLSVMFFWVGLIIYSLLIAIRNAGLIYKFILALAEAE
ncbi:hypothetical protein HB825_01575 [Listeria booriae]|uniref:hypothetical protein n=1 Tax=Listeria booriae TaxID=1552123 RepID=UPI00164E8CDD|nr:hypothetical protein [Listeria booriae]MBC1502438.1 hypothetical protein [Listeria booriae]MBC6133525.1 hypothetical protein [Listeria booriae]